MVKLRYIAAVLLLGFAGCPSVPTSDVINDVLTDGVGSFNDHTVSGFASTEDFHAWADVGLSPQQVKFALTNFQTSEGSVHFYDARFFSMHDEWYWYRLLNNQGIAGFPVMPVDGTGFDSIDAIYAALSDASTLPLDLRFTSAGRLYSPLFYDAALGRGDFEDGRFFGVGSLLYYPAQEERVYPGEIYCFELEFVDNTNEEGVLRFMNRLKEALPESLGKQLKWLSRGSTHQDALAEQIRAGNGPLKDKVLTYADLVVPGEEIPYNEGITAGRVKLFKEPVGGSQVGPRDIAVLAAVPDYLPPVAGIVTAVPQTPLAHLNLLAKARGTPNVHIGGIFSYAWLEEWMYWSTPVILKVDADGALWQVITSDQYQTYLSKLLGSTLTIEPIDLTDAPYTVDLTTGGLDNMRDLVPMTGGKAAGMRAFLDFPSIETPLKPMAVTIRGYKEHLSSYEPMLIKAMDDSEFQKDARVRFVFLEGPEDFLEEHAADPTAQTWLKGWLEEHGPTSTLGAAVAVGGFKKLLRSKPLSIELNELLTSELSLRYADLSHLQGIRFRSSSTAEDIKGFNGAGLYDSNTGYLYPDEQPTANLQKRSVEWALKKTWASYWAYEAFEERDMAGIDHLSGNMGVLVHPRFDDPMELSNGVITFTLKRLSPNDEFEMVVNVQKGALSVTNPDPKNPTTPEVDLVRGGAGEAPEILRIQESSEVASGDVIMSDADLLWAYDEVQALAQAWLDEENEAWVPSKKSSTLVLDLEFKMMRKDWPRMLTGETFDDRLILKQVRTLESAIKVEQELQDEPVPRDILSVTRKIDLRQCTGPGLEFSLVQFYTETSKQDLLNYAATPFVNRMVITFTEPVDDFDVKDKTFGMVHTSWKTLAQGDFPDGPWSLDLTLHDDNALELGFQRLVVDQEGHWKLHQDMMLHEGAPVTCEVETLSVGPSEYLESLLSP
jgi:hypothetical protein